MVSIVSHQHRWRWINDFAAVAETHLDYTALITPSLRQ